MNNIYFGMEVTKTKIQRKCKSCKKEPVAHGLVYNCIKCYEHYSEKDKQKLRKEEIE